MKVGIIDYGASNLYSIDRSLRYLGANTLIIDEPSKLKEVDKLIFPGQGSLGSAMSHLKKIELFEDVRIQLKEKPFLGICLGLQVLFSKSEEGDTQGYGFYKNEISMFPPDLPIKVPHMGWNKVFIKQDHDLFSNIENDTRFYFVHSYLLKDFDEEKSFSTTHHGIEFISSIGDENIFATQFHPEKSGEAGLKFFDNFLKWNP